MGGLVIKKAYILACQLREYESLANRICAIVFLATPHRGSDLAQTLTRILHIVPGARPFVQDLHRNSLATQSISDEFPQHCQDLQLFSFYETIPMNYGVGKALIVDKDLATLGYTNERTAYLDANHRDVCKYANLTDANYLTVRNTLASVVDGLRSREVLSQRCIDTEQRKLLESYLGVSDAPENDLMRFNTLQITGSCNWLTMKEKFLRWRDLDDTSIYWISAKPATGKSVLSGHIVQHLKDLNRDCSFYFFTYGDKTRDSIASFLRSITWQMAYMHPEILEMVLEIFEKDDNLGQADYRTLWRKVFLDGILKVQFERLQYMIVDAVDECKAPEELIPLLLRVTELAHVRVMITSRHSYELHRGSTSLRVKMTSDEIHPDDTKRDIQMYLEGNAGHLPLLDQEAQQDMVLEILEKSAGCLLWVALVLQELRRVHTSAEVRQVLQDIPSDMDELYSRILHTMSQAPYGKVLSKAILTWTVCSARALTLEELHHALQIDIMDSIDNTQKAINTGCGQLVFVDRQSRVHMVHQTARDFLLRSSTRSEFAIDKRLGHRRLAMTCLKYLNGNELRGPSHRKLSASNTNCVRCPFVAYACCSLFEHIHHVSSADDDFLSSLTKFLSSSNVLSWIEFVSQSSDLNILILTGRSFRNFLHRRSKHSSPLGREVAILDSWALDLIRIVTKFGRSLLAYPSSIFRLIPPFCPLETAPRRQFAASSRGISVLGLSATTWDDCLATIVRPHEFFSALACSKKYFAIGMSSGKILVCHETTCQEARTLHSSRGVKLLQFAISGDILASASTKSITLWDTTSWQQLWKFEISHMCLSLAFADGDNLLLGALKNNQLIIWDLIDGSLRDITDWTQDLESHRSNAFRRPMSAAFCMEEGLLAVIYRGQDLLVWDIERDTLHGTFCRDDNSSGLPMQDAGVLSVIFSTAPEANLLAAAYSSGALISYETVNGLQKEMTLANAQTLACSPNGRTLASGDGAGTVQLFDFETLKLLYRVRSDEYGVKSLAFSSDNCRLLDIRDSQCRVWDPLALVRQDTYDENSDTVSVSTVPQDTMVESLENLNNITSMTCQELGDIYFCGKEDGSVYLYNTKSGLQQNCLFTHAEGVAITKLLFDDRENTLSSVGSSGRVMVHKLIIENGLWQSDRVLFDHHTRLAVNQILYNEERTRMLISSCHTDLLCTIHSQESSFIKSVSWRHRHSYRWCSHPQEKEQLILIEDNIAHLYDWCALNRLTESEGILLEGSMLPDLIIRSVTPCFAASALSMAFGESSKLRSKSKLLLWESSDFVTQSKKAISVPRYQYLADQVEFLIGSYGQRLVFLHNSGWICSMDSTTTGTDQCLRHFFLPADWLTIDGELMIALTRKGDMIFVKREETAVIRRGLNNTELRSSDQSSKRPTLITPQSSSLSIPEL